MNPRRMPILAALVAALLPLASAFEPPTQGCLMILDDQQQPLGICPLEHTDVDVDIAGFIARVTLTQRFTNPSDAPIEAVYVFPMSAKAAVDTMEMTIGTRTIRGLIKERGEARQIYEAARAAGQTASLLDQERPNIFTQSVANIMPGNDILITISYVEYLDYEDGHYEFSFPMVVGPRYIPGAPAAPETRPGLRSGPPSTRQVPDAAKITPPIAPEGTRAGHDISLSVHLNAGVPIQQVHSELHEISLQNLGPNVAKIDLKDRKTIPNRDFILRYTVAGDQIQDAVLTHASAKGGFFTLILQPPDRVDDAQITPKEMIFVIDCSGSMRGFPIEKAKATMALAIENMNPDDTFNLISFSGGMGYCFDKPMPNTDENRRKAHEYLGNLQGGGGTEMMPALLAALEGQDDPERLRIVCFMTDGYIGNDMAILDAIQKNAHDARVFAFGIGNSINRFLIEGMGRLGRGASEVVTLESDGDEAARRFQERINDPILTDITVDFGGLNVQDVFPDPGAIPDLFASTPLVLKGKYNRADASSGTVTIRGMTSQGPWERRIELTLPADEPEFDVLAPLWARAKIQRLMDQDWHGAQIGQPEADIKQQVTDLGLTYNLVTQYTSFVAVEEKVINKDGKPQRIEVPVEMPDGVSHEGVFGDADASQPQTFGYLGSRRAAGLQMSGAVGPPPAANAPRFRREITTQVEAARPLADESKAVKPMDAPAEADSAALAKLDQALQFLAQNPRAGDYEVNGISVRNGTVSVVLELSEISDANLDVLKALGIDVTATVRSSNRIMAKVPVAKLLDAAKFDFVKAIRPSA